jgi:hypothetical protein
MNIDAAGYVMPIPPTLPGRSQASSTHLRTGSRCEVIGKGESERSGKEKARDRGAGQGEGNVTKLLQDTTIVVVTSYTEQRVARRGENNPVLQGVVAHSNG